MLIALQEQTEKMMQDAIKLFTYTIYALVLIAFGLSLVGSEFMHNN
jgi:hypothetical protein